MNSSALSGASLIILCARGLRNTKSNIPAGGLTPQAPVTDGIDKESAKDNELAVAGWNGVAAKWVAGSLDPINIIRPRAQLELMERKPMLDG